MGTSHARAPPEKVVPRAGAMVTRCSTVRRIAVSNSLAPDLRFRSETSIYRLHLEIGMEAPSA